MNSQEQSPARAASIRACAESHAALLHDLAGLTDIQARGPSLLPDWSVGHVLTHIARNADAFVRMFDGASRGEPLTMYEGGFEGRAADIEAGAGRSAAELVADVAAASARLESRFAQDDDPAWSGYGIHASGDLPTEAFPGRRRFEVEIHRIDLGLGYTFADLPADFVRAEVASWTTRWASRKPMGFSDLPAAALALAPADRLAWLLGRLVVDGLAPASLF